ncbi:hypothetical protein [Pedobacter ginsengisoli]|uniref:hypothetical protein n=1 Tax=Pedobacter ginsengisoli TaxID=363852 RepID=UPI002551717F|nr:hypothetical protein [Pedobacter ginsengisoli]
MLDRIRGWFELGTLIGAEIRLGQDGTESVQACTLQISGDRMTVKDQHTGLKNITHFAKHYKPGPLAVCLTGKGILTKQIQPIAVASEQVISQVLPNANAADFYFQLEQRDGHAVVSLVRRPVADDLIKELTALGFQVICLSLGALRNGQATSNLKPELMPAYDSAFQVLLKQELTGVDHAALNENRLQAFARAKVGGIAAVFGCVMLVLLVINFFMFSHYEAEAGRLSLKRNRSGMQVKKFQQMESDIQQKTSLITSAGWAGGYPYSWLTGQLMAGRPSAVAITQFSINPLKIQSGATSTAEIYETGKIRVSGTCDQAATLNNWLQEVRAKEWVKDCGILNYELNRESGKGQFTIDIEISDYEG